MNNPHLEFFVRYTRAPRDYAYWTWTRIDDEVIHCIPVAEANFHWFITIEEPEYRTKNLLRIRKGEQ